MAVMVEQKHVERLADGGLRYRRRFPRDVFRLTGRNEFRRVLKATGGTALTREIAKAEARYLSEVERALRGVASSLSKPGSSSGDVHPAGSL